MTKSIMLISGTTQGHNLVPLQSFLFAKGVEETDLILALRHAVESFRGHPEVYKTVIAAKEPKMSGMEEGSATFQRLISAFDLFRKLNPRVRLAVVSRNLTETEQQVLTGRRVDFFRSEEQEQIAAFCAGKKQT